MNIFFALDFWFRSHGTPPEARLGPEMVLVIGGVVLPTIVVLVYLRGATA